MNKSSNLIYFVEALSIRQKYTVIVPKDKYGRFSHGVLNALHDGPKLLRFETPDDAIYYLSNNVSNKQDYIVVWEEDPTGNAWGYDGKLI